MPTSIEDIEHISVASFQEFINDIKQLEQDMTKWDEEVRERVTNRKWWQFWIPRQWPPYPKG